MIVWYSISVEAYTASWIEMFLGHLWFTGTRVEAYTASWIEISSSNIWIKKSQSRLIQPRGLKYPFGAVHAGLNVSRLIQPRGLKYGKRFFLSESGGVEAYTASWIEILYSGCRKRPLLRRGLYSLVDWNYLLLLRQSTFYVEAYTASWIEIHYPLSIRLC